MHRPAIFAAVLGLGRAASNIGDHWVQNDHCARVKAATDANPVYTPTGNPDEDPVAHGTTDGIKACAWHCLTYTATQAAAVGIGARVLGIRLHPGAAAAALAVSGITHYIADRRVPGGVLETLAAKTGKTTFYKLADHGMNGAYALDQAWHEGWEAVAALVATTRATVR